MHNGIWVEKHFFSYPPSLAVIETLMSVQTRVGGPENGLNKAHLLDDKGIILMVSGEGCVLEFVFVFDPAEVPFRTKSCFLGKLEVNGVAFRRGLLLKDANLEGPIKFQKDIGENWVAEGFCEVAVSFRKGILTSLSFSF